jgi:hypothetical protein
MATLFHASMAGVDVWRHQLQEWDLGVAERLDLCEFLRCTRVVAGSSLARLLGPPPPPPSPHAGARELGPPTAAAVITRQHQHQQALVAAESGERYRPWWQKARNDARAARLRLLSGAWQMMLPPRTSLLQRRYRGSGGRPPPPSLRISAGVVRKLQQLCLGAPELWVALSGRAQLAYRQHSLERAAVEAREKEEEAQARRGRAEARRLKHPPALAPAYRDAAITAQAREYHPHHMVVVIGAAAVLAEIHICGVCSCQEILRRSGRPSHDCRGRSSGLTGMYLYVLRWCRCRC